MGFPHPGGDLTLMSCMRLVQGCNTWRKKWRRLLIYLVESEQNCSWEFKSHGERRQAGKFNLLFSWKGEELRSRLHIWLYFTSASLWVALLTWDLLSSIYDSATSTQGLSIYMSLISPNPDPEAFLQVYGSKILSEQEGSAGEKWHWDVCKSHFVLLLSTTHCLMQLSVWISTMTCIIDFFRDLSRIGQLSV